MTQEEYENMDHFKKVFFLGLLESIDLQLKRNIDKNKRTLGRHR